MKWNTLALLCMTALAGCSSKDWADTAQSAADSAAPTGAQSAPSVARSVASSIASAADTGQLMRYERSAPKVTTKAYTLYPVSLSERHAISAIVGGELDLTAPNGTPLKVRYDHHTESPDGNWTWIGQVDGGDPGQEAIITFGDKAVYGTIPQADGSRLNLTTRGGQVYVMQIDPDHYKTARPRSGGDMVAAPATAALTAADRAFVASASRAATKQVAAAATANATTAAVSTIDLSAGYTNGYAASQGSQSAATTRISYLVSVANQALTNSKVPGAIRLVSATQVIYPDNTDNGDALQELTGRNSSGAAVTVPASLKPLLDARETYGADLVTLVRSFDFATNNGCGIAWLNGADGVDIVPSQDDDYGFSVVSDGEDQGDDDNIYYCEDHSLAHEMAHNMGSAHDVDNADGQGRYPYSYGLKASAAAGNFYTVMAYGDSGQTSYNVFSNPNITTCGGHACGVANTADNARSLTLTMPVVSQFRTTKVPVAGVARQDVNADGKSDIYFQNGAARQFSYRLMSGTTTTSSKLIGGVGAGYAIGATGDFGGDKYGDVVWTSAKRDLYMWTGNGSTFSSTAVGTYPSGWVLVGSGDVDGDGKSDLLFHNAATRQFSYRLMNGTATSSSRLIDGVGAGYSVAAIGDFNGDGKADILWTSSKRDLYIWMGSGTGFSSSLVGTYPAGWVVVGAGDVNGDGKSDLVFHNAATRQFSYRLMNGVTTTSSKLISGVGAGYSVAAMGDYNGDSLLDVVWTSSARDMYMWVGNGSTFTSSNVGSYPAGWSMVK